VDDGRAESRRDILHWERRGVPVVLELGRAIWFGHIVLKGADPNKNPAASK